jgi:NAD(P)-dependent dehydrogenase (short-subunit alcohol dehydrogenase family)
MLLTDKVCVVTGAASGIGRATALRFAQEGARQVLVDLRGDELREVGREVSQMGGEAVVRQADVSSADNVSNFIDLALDRYEQLDVLFNNAGVAANGTVVSTPEQSWDRTLAVNLKSVYLGCHYAIPAMIKQGGGVIINTSSSWGLIGANNVAAYCAAKAGVVNLTRNIALDFAAYNVRANCICPGTTDTRMVRDLLADQPDPILATAYYETLQPLPRFARPEEIAAAVLFLAAESTYMTGAVLAVDGGYTAGKVAFVATTP